MMTSQDCKPPTSWTPFDWDLDLDLDLARTAGSPLPNRDLKSRDVWIKLKDNVEQFKRTLPLLTDLKNEAMRERHWLQLMDEIEIKFDPYAPDFTMDKVAGLRLDKYPEFIANLSISATQELNIGAPYAGVVRCLLVGGVC